MSESSPNVEAKQGPLWVLPVALVGMFILSAWPLLLLLLALTIAWRIFELYQWKQWSRQVNPFFFRLVQENRGCVTPLELAMRANLTAGSARKFLHRRAMEYGARFLTEQDQTVYFFLTSSTLGSILTDSEPGSLPPPPFRDEMTPPALVLPPSPEPTPTPEPIAPAPTVDVVPPSEAPSPVETVSPDPPPPVPLVIPSAPKAIAKTQEQSLFQAIKEANIFGDLDELDEEEETGETLGSLPLAELARRLDVHSSTLGKRKTAKDFADWSQARDPEGRAWRYLEEAKLFEPL